MNFRVLFPGTRQPRRNLQTILDEHHSILEKDKSGKPMMALNREAQTAALSLTLRNGNVDAFALAYLTTELQRPLWVRLACPPLTAGAFTGLICALNLLEQHQISRNTGFAFLAFTTILALSEPVSYLMARRTFLRSLKKVGKLVDLNIGSQLLPLTPAARDLLEKDGFRLP